MAYKGKYKGSEMDALFDKTKEAYTNEEIDSKVAELPTKQYVEEAIDKPLTQLMEGLTDTFEQINEQINEKQPKIDDLDTIRSGAAKGATALQQVPQEYVTESELNSKGYAVAANLAMVATSGSYNDLSNKPTIPSAVTESTVSGWGFTKNTGTYSKPASGIPKTDLAKDVQEALENVGGGGNVDGYTKEEVDALIAGCVPLSRDFSNDFNSDFAI